MLYNVTAISLMQATTPDRLLGRMNASRRFFVWGVIPLGAITGGLLATTIGLRPTLFIGAIGGSLAVLPLLLSPIRSLVRVPDEDQSSAIAVREQRVGEALPRQVRLRSQPRKPVAHRRQTLRVGGEPGERVFELPASGLAVEIGGDAETARSSSSSSRRGSPPVASSSSARRTVARTLLLVELDPLPGEPGEAK